MVARIVPASLQSNSMLDRNTVRKLLSPFDVVLSDESTDQLLRYLDLLLLWNRKINLTSIPTSEECVTRHFGESFFLLHATPLHGSLLDIGSGAGFPGLALKLLAPDLNVVLLEPVAKRRAFLKEVSRSCGMSSVEVLESRILEYTRTGRQQPFDLITVRAVGGLESLIPLAVRLLKPNGFLCLWLGRPQVEEVQRTHPMLEWNDPLPIPLSAERVILVGRSKDL